ncbi:Phototropin-2-like protein, partial [Drosera capensis]
MQVEISKYTEGINEKELRPNGLPTSLIRYDARQKEVALGSITEVVQTVKHPRSLIQDLSNHLNRREEEENFGVDYMLPKSAVIGDVAAQVDIGNESSQEPGKKSRKSVSLMGLVYEIDTHFLDDLSATKKPKKSLSVSMSGKHENEPRIEPEVLMTKDVDCADSWERNERGRDMRQGIDLATTLERIEKN